MREHVSASWRAAVWLALHGMAYVSDVLLDFSGFECCGLREEMGRGERMVVYTCLDH